MLSDEPAPTGEPVPRPRKARAGKLACGMLIWIRPEDDRAPTFYEVRAVGRTPDVEWERAYFLAKPGECMRLIVSRGSEGLHCSCADFAYGGRANGPEGCKHCRALVSFGLL